MFCHCVMYGNKLRVGGSEGVNERSGRRLLLPVFQKKNNMGGCDVQGESVLLELFLNADCPQSNMGIVSPCVRCMVTSLKTGNSSQVHTQCDGGDPGLSGHLPA